MSDQGSSVMTTASLQHAIAAVSDCMEARYQELNALDGKIGDGDLGITLLKASRALKEVSAGLPDDLGQACTRCAAEVANVSSSSFGTLLVTALMTTGSSLKGSSAAGWDQVPAILTKVVDALLARGKANLGDKTVVDALHAIAEETQGQDDAALMLATAVLATDGALETFRGRQAKLGRARMFGERTIGMDDPGMVALRFMVASLAAG